MSNSLRKYIIAEYYVLTLVLVVLLEHRIKSMIIISLAVLPPNLTNMTKITYLQALIDSSMPAELKKCNETSKKFAWTLNFAH